MFEPEKFFIGLIDFFSILLPGAIVAYLLKLAAPHVDVVLVNRLVMLDGEEGVAVFLVVSYLLGHFVFLIGAWWLDEAYDVLRGRTLQHQIHQLAWRGTLPSKLERGLIWLLFKRESNRAVDRAARLKEAYLGPLRASGAVNTFQWAKVHLVDHADALATVRRFEADSKFFRSLAVVLMFVALTAWPIRPALSLVAVGLLPLALWRYADQRLKATNQAYWSVLTLEAQSATPKNIEAARSKEPQPTTHGGGIVYRTRDNESAVEYLLVEAKNNPEEKVLPKGHVEEGEHSRETAVREVREETGVWASIEAPLPSIGWEEDGKPVTVRFYLMKACAGEAERPSERDRGHGWYSYEDAVAALEHKTSKDALRNADTLRRHPRHDRADV